MAGEDEVLTRSSGRAQVTTVEDNLHAYSNDTDVVSVGDAVYQVSGVDDKVALADADGGTTVPPIGVVVDVTTSTSCVVCHSGGIATGLSGLTRGTAYWLSTTAGALVGTKPGSNAYLVGVALSATSLMVACLPADLTGGSSTTEISHHMDWPEGSAQANKTNTYRWWAPKNGIELTSFKVYMVGINTQGNFTLTVKNKAQSDNSMLSTASFDMNTLTANTVTAMTLATGNDLHLENNEIMEIQLVSDDAAFDGTGIYIAFTFGDQ